MDYERIVRAKNSHRFVQTKRLFLAPMETADAPQVFKWAGDQRVTKFLRYTTYSRMEDLYTWIGSLADDTNGYEFGFFLHNGQLIGAGGVYPIKGTDNYEIGYNLNYDYWSQGYVTEATKAIMAWANSALGAQHFVISHAVDNVGSQRVIEKCGFTFDRMGSYSKFDGSATFESKHYVQNWERITYMNLRQTPFDSIASGNKTIEVRLWDEKRQNLQVGDTLAFTCGNKVAVCKVKDLLLFPTFKDLYNNVDLLQCGYDQESVKNASHKDMEEYYTIEEQQQYGVVGIQIELYCVYQKNN